MKELCSVCKDSIYGANWQYKGYSCTWGKKHTLKCLVARPLASFNKLCYHIAWVRGYLPSKTNTMLLNSFKKSFHGSFTLVHSIPWVKIKEVIMIPTVKQRTGPLQIHHAWQDSKMFNLYLSTHIILRRVWRKCFECCYVTLLQKCACCCMQYHTWWSN